MRVSELTRSSTLTILLSDVQYSLVTEAGCDCRIKLLIDDLFVHVSQRMPKIEQSELTDIILCFLKFP